VRCAAGSTAGIFTALRGAFFQPAFSADALLGLIVDADDRHDRARLFEGAARLG